MIRPHDRLLLMLDEGTVQSNCKNFCFWVTPTIGHKVEWLLSSCNDHKHIREGFPQHRQRHLLLHGSLDLQGVLLLLTLHSYYVHAFHGIQRA